MSFLLHHPLHEALNVGLVAIRVVASQNALQLCFLLGLLLMVDVAELLFPFLVCEKLLVQTYWIDAVKDRVVIPGHLAHAR